MANTKQSTTSQPESPKYVPDLTEVSREFYAGRPWGKRQQFRLNAIKATVAGMNAGKSFKAIVREVRVSRGTLFAWGDLVGLNVKAYATIHDE